jgi:hypothetical protein
VLRSEVPLRAAGVIAQLVGGVLPLSVASSLPAVIRLDVAGGAVVNDWGAPSLLRAGILVAVVVVVYWLMRRRIAVRAADRSAA